MSNTLKEIYDHIYFILGEEETSTIFNKEKIIIPSINRVQKKICRGKIKNILNGQTFRGGDLPFLHRDMIVEVNNTPIAIDTINSESSVIRITEGQDTSHIATMNGALLIDGIVVEYTEFTGEEFIGCNGVQQQSGKTAKLLYKIPEKVGKPVDVFMSKDNKKLCYYKNNEIVRGTGYTIYRDNEGYDRYIAFYTITGDVRIAYQILPNDMKKNDDFCGLPESYGVDAIAHIVAGEVLINTTEVNKGASVLNRGYEAVGDLYTYFNTEKKDPRKIIKMRPMHTEDLI